jgi:membrane-bound lytic murein transglycosylase D
MTSIVIESSQQAPRFPRFRLKRLYIVMASAVLLNACSTTYQPEITGDENSDAANATRSVANRDAAARVLIEPSQELSDVQETEYKDIWARIGAGLQFAYKYDNARIDEQIQFYRDNPSYLNTVTERASPFIYEIVEEVERRGLPMELALLPIVESAFNANAVSPGNSVGLWQINSGTAPTLGLKRDWWYDGSRDPIASTSAALDYLTTLQQMFDESWLLSLAAYNTGPGNVRKAINKNEVRDRDVDYWSLNLPSITADFAPKLIALSRLVAEPDHFGMELADVANAPAVKLVDVGYQLDLAFAATIAGIDTQTLYQLNPGYRQWATHPDGPYSLLVPAAVADAFALALLEQRELPNVTWDRYVVQGGDTLSKIAQQFRTQVSVLQQVNAIEGSRIIAGESLLIPRAYASTVPIALPNAPDYPATASRSSAASTVPPEPPARYSVRSGDSLWLIANRYQLSVAELTQWNNLEVNALLRPGQELVLQADATLAQTDSNPTPEAQRRYTVRSGDSLARIAQRFLITAEELASWNSIQLGDLIHPGQQLLLIPSDSNLN